MFMLTKPFVYITVLLATLMAASISVHASPKSEMRNLMTRYELIGRIDEVNQMNRTIVMNGKKYSLAAGVTILGMGDKSKYNIKTLKPGMQIGYKLLYNSSSTISELWVMPE